METAPLNKSKVKFEGVFDWEGLYKFMRGWLVERHFIFIEKHYRYKVPTPLGAELIIMWSAWRKETDFIRYWIDVNFHFWDMEDVEVIHEGKKKKMKKGRFEIIFNGRMDTDYQEMFEKTPFLKKIEKFIYKFIFTPQKEGGKYWDELYYIVYRFQTSVKKYLKIHASESAYG